MSNKSVSTAFPLTGITFLVFLVLKLCKVIDWSWWWITAPLWGCFALFVFIMLLVFLVLFISGTFKK